MMDESIQVGSSWRHVKHQRSYPHDNRVTSISCLATVAYVSRHDVVVYYEGIENLVPPETYTLVEFGEEFTFDRPPPHR